MIARGSGFVRGSKPRARARLIGHLKYIEHRSQSERESRDDRRIFSAESDVVSRQQATAEVMAHTSSAVNYHRLILMPGAEEPVPDWREWTRDVMADLETHLNKELTWFAVKHDNTQHPHVHVVLAGAGANLETGRVEPVKLYTAEYQLLRESGQEHSEYEWQRSLEQTSHSLEAIDERMPDIDQLEQQQHSGKRSPLEQLTDFDFDFGG